MSQNLEELVIFSVQHSEKVSKEKMSKLFKSAKFNHEPLHSMHNGF